MDAKLSCLIYGLVGVIFGGLALTVPDSVLYLFIRVFWLLIILGIVMCVLIAISSSPEESFFWFLCSAALLVVGIVSAFFPNTLALIFVLVVAVLAFYAGYSGGSVALTKPHSKYILIASVIIASIILMYLFVSYIPAMGKEMVMTVVGTFALVLGVFAVVMGVSIKEMPVVPVSPHVLVLNTTCKFVKKNVESGTVPATNERQTPADSKDKPSQ